MDTRAKEEAIGGIRVEPRPLCILCGGAGKLIYQALVDHQYGVSGEWRLRECLNAECGLVWQDPMALQDDLPLAYKSYYTHGAHDAFETGGPLSWAFAFLDRRTSWLHGLQEERQHFSQGYLDDLPPGLLLDVGCGNGEYGARMRSQGWAVRGTDFDPDAAKAVVQNHGFAVDVGELHDLGYPDGAMDAVTARHVLEHMHDPIGFMRECWRILKPGGRLVYITPNVASLGHRIFGEHWQGLEAPRHLFLFDVQTLRALARLCGVEPTAIFSTAQGASYIFRSSEGMRTGKYDAAQSWPRTLLKFWSWQLREIRQIRKGIAQCGEELVLIANKLKTGGQEPRKLAKAAAVKPEGV